jgi:Holliday junction resolvasome RuvABC ATP-dependent DNA helicase subunit
VLDGVPGNGKTFLIELFAKEYDCYLQVIDAYDVTDMNEFNNILKTLNLLPIECNQTKKIILVENINEFHKNYRTRLFEIQDICKYPIVYTGTRVDIPGKYRNKIEVFRINKPVPTEIKNFLNQKVKELKVEIEDEVIEQIARQSPSIRSATNSLYNSSPNDITNPIPTLFEQVNNIKYKVLKDDVDATLLHYIFGNVNNHETMAKLCDYDMELNRQFTDSIDKYLFNNMPIGFTSNSYPEFMMQEYKNNKEVEKYLPSLHVSKRIFKREFLELIRLLENPTTQKENINKNTVFKYNKSILNFV